MDNDAAYVFPRVVSSMPEMTPDDLSAINIDKAMLGDQHVECHLDSECNLLVPFCLAGMCKPIPGFNTTVGRCECDNCELVIIERNESTTARACADVCARMKNCVGMEANYQ